MITKKNKKKLLTKRSDYKGYDNLGVWHDGSDEDIRYNWLVDENGYPKEFGLHELVVTPNGSHTSSLTFTQALNSDNKEHKIKRLFGHRRKNKYEKNEDKSALYWYTKQIMDLDPDPTEEKSLKYLENIEKNVPDALDNLFIKSYKGHTQDVPLLVIDDLKWQLGHDLNSAKSIKSAKDNLKQRKQQAFDDNFTEFMDRFTGGMLHNYLYTPQGYVKNGNLFNKALRGYRKYINPIATPEGITGKGSTMYDLSNNVLRATKDSKQKNLLWNEFVEERNPSIYPASLWRNGSVKTVGDAKMPRLNFEIFVGIEDGVQKTGPISIFRDDTLVFPARNVKSSLNPVTELHLPDLSTSVDLLFENRRYGSLYLYNFAQNDYYKNIVQPILAKYGPKSYELLNYLSLLGYHGLNGDPNYTYLKRGMMPWEFIDEYKDNIKLYREAMDPRYNTLKNRHKELEEQILRIHNSDLPNANRIAVSKYYIDKDWNLFREQGWNVYSNEDLQKMINDAKNSLRNEYEYKRMYNATSKELHSPEMLEKLHKLTELSHRLLNFEDVLYDNSDLLNGYLYTDVNGDTKDISNWNASILDGKLIFGNPEGGIFVNRIQDISKPLLEFLNNYLKLHPSYIIRPDLGGFGLTMMSNPTLKHYVSQYSENLDPYGNNIFVIGTNNDPITVEK